MFTRTVKAFFLALAMVGAATTAQAVPISYAESATISGTLGGTPFSNALITINGSGNTTNVINDAGIWRNLLATVTFSISGVGSGTFSSMIEVFDNPGYPAAGFYDSVLNASILDTIDNAFVAYGLITTIGPITNTAFIRPDIFFATTAGDLNITASGNATFCARTSIEGQLPCVAQAQVPEPATLYLVGMGLAGLVVRRRRKTV